MGNLRKKLETLGIVAGSVIALSLSKSDKMNNVEPERSQSPAIKQTVTDVRSLIDENISQEDRETLMQLISWAEEIPAGKQILQAIAENGTKLTVGDNAVDKVAGSASPNLSEIVFNRSHLKQGISSFGTFIHEGEHVRTISNDHKHGISLGSFDSLDDKFTWDSIREACAVRKQITGVYELLKVHPELDADHQYADMLRDQFNGNVQDLINTSFEARLTGNMLDSDDAHRYEDPIIWSTIEKNEQISNPIKLPQNPDWDKLVQISSGGEIQKLNVTPIPSMNMIEAMVERGCLDQGVLDGARVNINKLDLTNVEKNKGEILTRGDFCYSVCERVAQDAFFLLMNTKNPDLLKPWLNELKTIMPQEQIDKLVSEYKDCPYVLPQDFYTEGYETFMDNQNPFDYLKKVQKTMASPKLIEACKGNLVGTQDDFPCRLHLTQEMLKVYDHVLFEKENKDLVMQSGRSNKAEVL